MIICNGHDMKNMKGQVRITLSSVILSYPLSCMLLDVTYLEIVLLVYHYHILVYVYDSALVDMSDERKLYHYFY